MDQRQLRRLFGQLQGLKTDTGSSRQKDAIVEATRTLPHTKQLKKCIDCMPSHVCVARFFIDLLLAAFLPRFPSFSTRRHKGHNTSASWWGKIDMN